MAATKRELANTMSEAVSTVDRALAVIEAKDREIGRLQRELFEARVQLHYARRLQEAQPAVEAVQ